MNFVVQFLHGSNVDGRASVVRTADFEADDMYEIVSRTRIILASPTYEPSVDGFQIVVNGNQVIFYEPRGTGSAEQKDPVSHATVSWTVSGLREDFMLTRTFQQKAERIGRMVPPLMTKAIAEAVYEKVLKPSAAAAESRAKTLEKAT
jgi:hypothetical protein